MSQECGDERGVPPVKTELVAWQNLLVKSVCDCRILSPCTGADFHFLLTRYRHIPFTVGGVEQTMEFETPLQ
ncbi:hypothetical protein ESFECK385B1_21825 [Escherichia fergusonii]